jgi:hypothetical protein
VNESDLVPAQHVVPAPKDGWRAADLDDSELVDDDFIAADPDSFIVGPPEAPDGA